MYLCATLTPSAHRYLNQATISFCARAAALLIGYDGAKGGGRRGHLNSTATACESSEKSEVNTKHESKRGTKGSRGNREPLRPLGREGVRRGGEGEGAVKSSQDNGRRQPNTRSAAPLFFLRYQPLLSSSSMQQPTTSKDNEESAKKKMETEKRAASILHQSIKLQNGKTG